MLREMKISGLTMDPQTNTPIVVLKDTNSDTVLPIWIGLLEATAIATELEQIQFPRPMTHDLIKNLITHLGVTVDRVEVCDLRDNTFYAWIYLMVQGKESKIDARPSDALALALRTSARIYVNEKVLDKSKKIETGGKAEIQDEEAKKWTDILENLSPEDFGKYKM
ncbi:MAG TPA: bifunctional nuclease domain-containing protein [Syntrophobacteria bacterium]|nr:bifunctional nuclease domain-containing protein [Syntrophobacteria bacterium]